MFRDVDDDSFFLMFFFNFVYILFVDPVKIVFPGFDNIWLISIHKSAFFFELTGVECVFLLDCGLLQFLESIVISIKLFNFIFKFFYFA